MTCSVPGCQKPAKCKGLCGAHYERQRLGSPLGSKPIKARVLSDNEREMAYVDKSGGPDACWPWTGGITSNGYGNTAMGVTAHRWMYERHIGPLAPGFVPDHTCHDPRECEGGWTCPHRRCVNPAHLEGVTQQENVLRGRKGRYARGKARSATT